MGRYSRKDMLEFAKFAKSYQSNSNVIAAYKAYLSGDRQFNIHTDEKEVKRIKAIRNKRKILSKVNSKKVRKIIIY